MAISSSCPLCCFNGLLLYIVSYLNVNLGSSNCAFMCLKRGVVFCFVDVLASYTPIRTSTVAILLALA